MEHVSQSATAESAMTEIALALAMGFFAIMVLTMVSMGAGQPESAEKAKSVAAADLMANVATAPSEATTELGADDLVVIYYKDSFFSPDMKPVDIAGLAPESRVILAVPPDLPLSQAIDIRGRFNRKDLVVSTLDARWMKALEQAPRDMLSPNSQHKEDAK
mgnify:CR=1 FL=1